MYITASEIKSKFKICSWVDEFVFNGPSRQYFSLHRAVVSK